MFITFEGVEGSGKTTIINMISDKLNSLGIDYLHVREPGGVKISEQIRNIILDKNNTEIDDRCEALLFAASRRQLLVEKIFPALKENKVVLCDRFIDSSLAYQGGGKGLGIENVLNINLFATENTLPDLTLFFDIDPKIGLERIAKNNKREVNRLDLQKLDFYNKTREAYLNLTNIYKNRYVIIDASKSISEVFNIALKIILDKLNEN